MYPRAKISRAAYLCFIYCVDTKDSNIYLTACGQGREWSSLLGSVKLTAAQQRALLCLPCPHSQIHITLFSVSTQEIKDYCKKSESAECIAAVCYMCTHIDGLLINIIFILSIVSQYIIIYLLLTVSVSYFTFFRQWYEWPIRASSCFMLSVWINFIYLYNYYYFLKHTFSYT